MAFITAETRSDLIELSVAMLKQAPSAALLEELIALSVGGGSLADAADHIAKTDAFKAEYPSFQTAEQYAAEIFDNITTGGTVTADIRTAVIELATGMLTSGSVTKAGLALAIAEYLAAPAALLNTDFADIAQSFQNRADAAEYFVVTKELGGSTDAELAAAIASVTSDAATLTAANTAADATASAVAVVAGQSFTLTTGLDNKTLGAGDDQAFATDSTTAADDTFNPSDKVDGGAGDDTFYLTLSDTAAETDAEYTPSRITNFETLSVTNVDEADTLDMNVSLMALSAIENAASSSPVTVTGATAGTTLTATGNTAATSLEVLGAGLTGADDTAVISLTGNSGAITYKSSTAQDIEKAAFTVTGINSGKITITDSGGTSAVKSATVSGSGSYDMTTAGTFDDVLETLDASANTGGVTFTATVSTGATLTGGAGNDVLTGGTGNDVIKGGAGEDTLAMGSAGVDHIDGGAGNDTVTVTGLTEDDSIVGGDGVDTLVIGAAIAYDDEATPTAIDDAVNISGFEVLRGTAALSQDMAALSGIVALQSTGGVLTATEASDIADFFAYGLTDVEGAGLDLTLATDGAADSLNIHVGLDAAQTKATSVTVDAVEIETALINSVGKDGNTITSFEADALTALTVIGSKNLEVTLDESAAVTTLPLTKIDASGFTGDSLTITAVEADSGVTVTTGSEALSVTVGDGANNITGTAGADTITTGSGADTIVSYAGDDTIEAGDGANTITVTDGENDIDGGEGVDTITAGNGNNTIDGGDGADVIVAGTGNNTITNSAGNATITAGNGNNNVTNTAGNSTITLGNGTNVVNLTAGNSTVITGSGADDINITAGNNDITAGDGNDSISLGSGNDTVDAGAGTDTVDFSVSSGTWTGSVSNAETIAASFSGSAKIDAAGISGYTTLTVAASGDTSTVELKNLASATVSLTDDNAEAGGTGDLEAVTVDTVDDATITLSLGANQNAATAVASVLGSLTITDAESVTLKSTGGSFGNLIENDFEGVALDDDETTALVVDASSAYSSIATAAITGTEGLSSLSLSATGTESDIEVDTIADATDLQTLSITASGLNSQVELGIVGNEASTTDAILTSFSVTASNGADVDFAGSTDAELGDINTAEDMTSAKISASGVGTTVTAGEISADGLEISSVELEASAGGVIDMETVADAAVLNYSYDSLTLQATGVNSSLTVGNLAQDSGSLAATAEATITFEADDYGTIALGAEAEVGGVDLDSVHIGIGNGASLTGAETTLTATGDIGSLDIDLDANSTNTGQFDIGAGKILSTLSLNIGDEAAYDAEAFLITLSDDVEASVGIKTLNIDIADQDGNAITVDLEATASISIATTGAVADIVDSEGDVSTYYNGSITLAGDDANTVVIGNQSLLDTALPTPGSASVYGAWTINTGDGGDTITGSRGADNITSNAGDDSVLGGAGNDTLTVGNGADTVGGGAGTDSIVLTESVSSADVVQFSVDAEASSDSSQEVETGNGNDVGQDTITSFTAGVDTISITVTDVESFTHGNDTDLGDGTSTSTSTDGSEAFATNVGLINFDGETADKFGEAGDLIINFSAPTTTMTEALFEAALQYNVTGTATADTIVTGALADTYTVTAGNDDVDLGAGDDTLNITEALMIANSGTTATHDGGDGTDTIVLEAASINIEDADFARISNFETLTLVSGINNVVVSTNAAAAGIVTINGGTGADTISVAAGDKTIALGASDDSAIDTILLTAVTGKNTVTGFVSAQDTFEISGTLKTALSGDTAEVAGDVSLNTNQGASYAIETAATGYVTDAENGTLVAADLTDLTKIATAITAAFLFTDANGDTANVEVFAVESDTAGTFGIYAWTQSSATDTTVGGDELVILGIVTGTNLAAADLDIAS